MNEITPDSSDAIRALIAMEEDVAANEMAERMIAAGTEDPYVYWVLGSDLITREDYDRALILLEKAHALAPNDTATLYDLALVLRYLVRSEDARPVLNVLLQQEAENWDARLILANIDSDAEKYDAAEVGYRLILENEPTHVLALSGYGLMLTRSERYEESEAVLLRGLALDVNNENLLYNLVFCCRMYGSALMEKDDTLEKALRYLREACTIDPEFPDTLYNLGVTLRKLGRDAEAIPFLERVATREPDAMDARTALASAYYNIERYEEAEPIFLSVLKKEPDNTIALNNYGRMLCLTGRYQEAETVLKQGIAADADDPILHRNLADTYYGMGKDEAALAEYRIVSSLAPDNFDTHINLGSTLVNLERWEEAYAEFNAALTLDPKNLDAYYGLGNVYTGLNEYEKAEREYQYVLEREPDDVATLNNYGRMLQLSGRYEEAIDILLRGLALEPEDIDLNANLAECYQRLSQESVTVDATETDPGDWIAAGDIYAGLERWEEALGEYEMALSIAPDNEEIREKIATVKAALA